ncbi:D-alanyl-D-alanine carboxypeptidase/D-alanyl-D-alanine endopeptidase [Saccharothrix variisporea]|uniref:D-alanyl-D-alanine carboxypeptidase/D-alanyl-D-alanine-endopeptidase (Penicillin-binding protein 4) n=2 Tax=Saccharothrix variisporea TaxID=543527 RepID=A0A495XC42_9PSEU|nr:D-alanyl-D-alanine carboxypeptidase/D-alanyl-D-alanine-endopeptidase [Saccharothrix variisporea]RKT71209.1 D-alanyl-D-alanine carboxypeptidase/D-alanyl-D-alanine-endopeptidase (penicillin-binding protein 4) [Saccharothrix variisporea]
MPDEPSWPTVDDDEAVHEPPTVQVRRPGPGDSPTMRIPVPPPAPPASERTAIVPKPVPPPAGDQAPREPRNGRPVTRVEQPATPPRGPEATRSREAAADAAWSRWEAAADDDDSPAKDKPEPAAAEEHAKPERVGTAEEPERRKRPLALVGALVAVLVLVAGGVTSWQLGWFDTAPVPTTAAPQPPAPVSLAVKGIGTEGPVPSASGVAAALRGPAGNPDLGTLTGTVVDPGTGQALWKQGDTTPLTPASTVKILVAAASLLALDHTSQLSTKVVQGTQPGTVVLVGGGDPTLSSFPADRSTVYPGAATLDDLASQVTANGPVTQVLYDTSRYQGDGMAPGWDPGDVPGGYVSPIGPLMLDGGRQDPTAYDTPRTGTPAATTAQALASRVGAASTAPGTAPAGAKVLGEVKSAPVDQLVENLMQISDNVLAETMAREVAIAKGLPPTFEGAVQAVRAVLTENGFDLTGAEVVDASGLSKNDKVPARLLTDVLAAAAKPDASDPKTAKLRPLLTALPVAGGSGTLAGRYGELAGKGWVRAKTGTLTSVNSLAGVVVDNDGRVLVFAFMSISGEDPRTKVRPGLDALATALRGCGCT